MKYILIAAAIAVSTPAAAFFEAGDSLSKPAAYGAKQANAIPTPPECTIIDMWANCLDGTNPGSGSVGTPVNTSAGPLSPTSRKGPPSDGCGDGDGEGEGGEGQGSHGGHGHGGHGGGPRGGDGGHNGPGGHGGGHGHGGHGPKTSNPQ